MVLILFFVVAGFCGLKLGEKRLRSTRLILDEDFLFWQSPNDGTFQIMYSDIREVKKKNNKEIVIKIKNSFRKINILRFIEDMSVSCFSILKKQQFYALKSHHQNV